MELVVRDYKTNKELFRSSYPAEILLWCIAEFPDCRPGTNRAGQKVIIDEYGDTIAYVEETTAGSHSERPSRQREIDTRETDRRGRWGYLETD